MLETVIEWIGVIASLAYVGSLLAAIVAIAVAFASLSFPSMSAVIWTIGVGLVAAVVSHLCGEVIDFE